MTKGFKFFRLFKGQNSLRIDYFITSINGLMVLMGVFVLNGLIARKYGLEVLGEFLLIKRTTLSLMGILLLGMNIGVPSMLGRWNTRSVEGSAFLLFTIFTIPIIAAMMLLVHLGLAPGFVHSNSSAYGIYMAGIAFQAMIYGIYRGHLKMMGANSIQLLGTAIMPIIVFSYIGIPKVSLTIIGFGMILISGISYLLLKPDKSVWVNNTAYIKKLTHFGGERIISFISQFILLAGAPILVSFSNPYSDLAFFNSLISIVRTFLFVIGPLGIVLLPRIARLVETNGTEKIGQGLAQLLELIVIVSCVLSIFLSSMGGDLLNYWLGSITDTGSWMASVILLTIPFYLVAEILRSPIDALSDKGYNSIIYFFAAISLVVTFFAGVYFQVPVLKAGVYGFFLGYLISALGSLMVIRKLTNFPMPSFKSYLRLIVFSGGSYAVVRGAEAMNVAVAGEVLLKIAFMVVLISIFMFQSRDQVKSLNSFSKIL